MAIKKKTQKTQKTQKGTGKIDFIANATLSDKFRGGGDLFGFFCR